MAALAWVRSCGWLVGALLEISLVAGETPRSPGFLIRNWTTADGLPENTVRAIVETRDGYLWVGTANGLARFDGVRFTRFDSANTPSLHTADIFGLHEDRQGGLWLSTRRGIFRYADGRFESMPRPQDGLAVALRSLTVSPDGELWMLAGDGLARWSSNHLERVVIPAGPVSVRNLCAASHGVVWLAAANGLWRLQNGRIERVVESPAPDMVAASLDGTLWGLVGERWLYELRDGRWSQMATTGDERVSSLYCAPDGDVWFGAGGAHRAYRYRAGQLTEINGQDGLDGNRVICFCEDRDGNLWMGMNGAGLYRLRERRLRIFRREDGLRNLSLASVCQDADGSILANVMGQTMHRFVNDRFEPIDVAASNGGYPLPTAMAPAPSGGVWAGTFYGSLLRIDRGRIVERIGAEAGTRALFIDRDGVLWRGTRTAGVERIAGTNVVRFTTNEGLSFNNVYCFAQDRDGAVWAGTEEGLNRIADGHITHFGRSDGLGHHFISALCVDSRGTLWVGTLGGGLSTLRGSRFVTLTTREGIPDDSVQQLLEDDHGQLWIGTRAGLMRAPLEQLHELLEGRRRVITGALVGRNEGLPRPDCWTEYQPAGLKARDGRLWFCTSSGVVLIDPQRFSTAAPAPIVHIEELRVDDQPSQPVPKDAPPIVVPPRSQRVEIHYTGLSPSGPELVRFRYRLDGYDRDWVEAGKTRFASYTHLPPGRFKFRVQAANNDGVWDETGANLAMVVEPTFWQTDWFRAVLFAVFIGTGPAIYRWRVRRLEQRRLAQEAFARQLIDSQEQERKRIAAELHDSLGQNLLVVRNLALMGTAAHSSEEPVAGKFREISEAAREALAEVRSISRALRPVELDRLGLTKSVQAAVQRVGESSGIELRSSIDNIDGALPPNEEINLYRIVQECLNNIVKHSEARTASIECRRDGAQILLTVADDGRGFDANHLANPDVPAATLGLVSIVERAHTLGGTAQIQSRPGHGTRVDVVIPVRRNGVTRS